MLLRWMPIPQEIWNALEAVVVGQTPVRIEVERSMERFMAYVAVLRRGGVVLRADHGTLSLMPGDFIRVLFPGDEHLELRLEVVKAHPVPGQDGFALHCRPERKLARRRRKVDRYNVRRYGDLRLELEGERFRLLDISSTGCKVSLATAEPDGKLPVGYVIRLAVLAAGPHAMHLERLVPRSKVGDAIGCEFRVRQDGRSERVLDKLLTTLEHSHGAKPA